jgi:ABC-type dipeptide/oligopeptide/nickel transport system permease subunit
MPVVASDVGASSAVSTVLGALSTYATGWVSDVTTWMTGFIPVVLPLAGIALAIAVGLKIFKRFSKA